MNGAGGLAVGAAGGLVLLLAGIDIFIAVFNHDGFTFLAGRLHAATWAGLRLTSRLPPRRAGHGYRSSGWPPSPSA